MERSQRRIEIQLIRVVKAPRHLARNRGGASFTVTAREVRDELISFGWMEPGTVANGFGDALGEPGLALDVIPGSPNRYRVPAGGIGHAFLESRGFVL